MVGRIFIFILVLSCVKSVEEEQLFFTPPLIIPPADTNIFLSTLSADNQLRDCGIDCDMFIQVSQDTTSPEIEKVLSKVLNYFSDLYSKTGTTYLTICDFKDQIAYEQNVLEKMKTFNKDFATDYYEPMIEDLFKEIENQKVTLERMQKDDLVFVITNGIQSFMPVANYSYQQKIKNLVHSAETFLQVPMTSADLYNLYNALSDLQSELRSDDSCTILETTYSYSELAEYAESVLDQAHQAEHSEKLKSVLDLISSLYDSAGEYWAKSEINDLLNAWDSLISELKQDDTVYIFGVPFDKRSSKEMYYELKGVSERLQKGEIATFNNEGKLEIVATPIIKTSNHMTGRDYFDLIKNSPNYKENLPVVTTDQVFFQISSKDIQLEEFSSRDADTFIQTSKESEGLNRLEEHYPYENRTKEFEYYQGKLSFILVTSFQSDQNGTGKIIAFDAESPENYAEILSGFNKPTGVCFDVNHNFLYVVENGGQNPGIYQFQMDRSEFLIKFLDPVYVVIYSGKPVDCKVDGFGNLFFTEEDSSIKEITYYDLYFAYPDNEITIYSNDLDLEKPTSMELRDSKDLYFVNHGTSSTDGTINVANIDTKNSTGWINVTIQDTRPAKGLTVTLDKIFYSLDGGIIKSYSLLNEETYIYNMELENPTGLCSSNNQVFAVDYSRGVVYKGENSFISTMNVFIYLQAPYSCFCLNFQSSSLQGVSLFAFLISFFVL